MKANVLALLAACAFALGNVLQQKGTLEAPAQGDDPRFLVQVLCRPVWLAGGAFQISGWIHQAVALDTGSLIDVQSLTTMSLVIALPLGKRITGQEVSRRVWTGAAAIHYRKLTSLLLQPPWMRGRSPVRDGYGQSLATF